MTVERSSGKFFLAVLSGLVLSACSPSASTAVPPVQAAVPPPTAEPPVAAAPVAPLVTGLPDFTGLVERYGPAVVNVQVESRRQASQTRGGDAFPGEDLLRQFGIPVPMVPRGQPQPARGQGSGFIVSADGYILTNAHVVRGGTGAQAASSSTDVTVKLTDRREFPATIVGFDERTDIAVIKIDATDLPVVRIGDPNRLKPGQWVIAIGSPFGMENSVTAGIVSALSRNLPSELYVPFIQTDVAVNPGNSGGPLFNLNGEVVGINSQIYSQNGGYMGLSFAIPIDIANNVREQLITDGRVTRGKIGVKVGPVDATYAEAFGLERPRGALVSEVIKGDPAEKAGIRAGDIILSVNGRPVESDSTALPAMISALRPGQTAELELWGDRKLRKVKVDIAELVEEGAAASAAPQRGGSRGGGPASEPAVLGLSLRQLTGEEQQRLGTEGSLVVEAVTGPAERSQLQRGDVIIGVAGRAVKNVAELQDAVKNSGRVVPLRVQRGEAITFVTVRAE